MYAIVQTLSEESPGGIGDVRDKLTFSLIFPHPPSTASPWRIWRLGEKLFSRKGAKKELGHGFRFAKHTDCHGFLVALTGQSTVGALEAGTFGAFEG